MSQVNKPNTFTNGTTIDATQVNADFDTLYNDVNGQLDDSNMRAGSLKAAIATEGVNPTQTEGVPYAVDIFTSSFVFSGLSVTKDSTTASQIDISAGVVYILQPDGSLRRVSIASSTQKVAFANTTYYLDLNPDGTWNFAGTHSNQNNYLPIATVTTDVNSNVNTITDSRPTTINLLAGATGSINMNTIDSQNARVILAMGGF